MTKGLRRRLIAFVILAAIGIIYVSASYLGVVDTILGRKVSMYVDLPRSGGLYVGSEVDIRGVKIGKVTGMTVTPSGVRVQLQVNKDAKLPSASAVQVADLTAVGEQYLDFQPADSSGPYAASGHVFSGDSSSLPLPTEQLLTNISDFATSVNPHDLATTVHELGTMFNGNGDAISQLIQSGSQFVSTASAHLPATLSLIDSSQTVLNTQAVHAADIVAFSHGLAQLTDSLKTSDPNLRTILNQGVPAVKEVDSLVNMLVPVLPSFLASLVTTTTTVDEHLTALEQTLVVFPPVVETGFIGTPGDGYGHLNMQFDYNVPVCTGAGYLPKPWPGPLDTGPQPLDATAHCADPKAQRSYTGPGPLLQRGVNMVPTWAPIN